jgi:hypothetical protein
MSKGAKIAIIVTLSVLALFGSCVGGALWWWSENGEDLMEAARSGIEEGAEFGRTAQSQETCLEHGIEMSAECGQLGISCGTKAQLFTQGCLYSAPAVPGICDDVPSPTEVIDTVSWSSDHCQERGQSLNNFCGNVLSSLQAYCNNPDLELDLAQFESE